MLSVCMELTRQLTKQVAILREKNVQVALELFVEFQPKLRLIDCLSNSADCTRFRSDTVLSVPAVPASRVLKNVTIYDDTIQQSLRFCKINSNLACE